MRVVSFMNYKGGVGKTTITANIGAGLAARGHRVLLIDLDPQANLTQCFFPYVDEDSGIKPDSTIKRWFAAHANGSADVPSLSDLAAAAVQANSVVGPHGGHIDVIQSHLELLEIDMELAAWLFAEEGQKARINRIKLHRFLADALEDDGLTQYDFVLIDCAPDFGIVTRIAMVASDFVVVPAKPEPLSTNGIGYLHASLERLVGEYNGLSASIKKVRPKYLGVVFNMVQIYSGQPIATQQEVIAVTTKNIHMEVFETMLRNASRAAIASSKSGVPAVLRSAVDGELVGELNALTDEFLRRIERS